MWRSALPQTNNQLTKFIEFKPTDSKEAKQRDPYGPKIEIDVVVFCINCMPEYAQKDIEELRMFEYSLSYYNQIYHATRQKLSARAEATINPQAAVASQSMMAPAIITNSYILPPPSTSFNTLQMPQFNHFGVNTQQTTSVQSGFNSCNFNTVQPQFSQQNTGNISSFLQPFSNANNPSNIANNQSFNLGNSLMNSSLLNNTSQNITQQQFSGLSSVWTNPVTTNSQNNISNITVAQPQVVYPTNYAAYGQPQFYPPPPPVYYPNYYTQPRYRLPPDLYQFSYEGYGRDPYNYLYRDSFVDQSVSHRQALQRQAARHMWLNYGVDPSIPLSDSFMQSREAKKHGSDRELSANYYDQSKGSLTDPVIHVVPTLAGFRGGKQQIVLDIEETPENRSYIPKIFNPNSEISFTISSKESPANKSYLANIIADNVDEAAAENINQSTKQSQKDLPRPILNKKMTSKKKSLLDMELSDYQLSPKVESIPESSERRRVTFEDESIKKSPNINDSQFFSPLLASNVPKISLGQDSSLSTVIPSSKIENITSLHDSNTDIKFPSSFNLGDSKINNSSLHLEEKSYISKFKWTPSWFISKLVSSFSQDPQENSSITQVSTNSISNSCGVILNREAYYTQPTIEEMDQMVVDNHCFVKAFTIGRYNVGKVTFEGKTDVYGLNLDKIVFISDHEIEVYKDEDSYSNKPPVGSGLNKPARLTLFNVYPKDRDGKYIKVFDKDSLRDFEEYLLRKSNELNAEFIDYIPETGSFTFSVQHFTKYGVLDEVESLDISDHFSNYSANDKKTIILEEKQNHKLVPWRNSNKRKYRSRLRNLIARPELFSNDSGFQWTSSYTLWNISFYNSSEIIDLNLSNQYLQVSKLSQKSDIDDLDFIFSTNIKTFLSSIISSVLFSKGLVPFCLFENPDKIFEIYSENSNIYLFSMIHSLWRKDTTFTFHKLDSCIISKKKHFLNWLRDFFKNQANLECRMHLKNNEIFSAVLSYLSANLINQAVELLNSTNNPRLACMIANNDPSNRIIMAEQLDRWLSTGLYEQMDLSYIKIITLLSGRFVIEFEDKIIHVCEGFDWLRSFGLFLNFCEFDDNPMLTAFNLYCEHYKDYSSLLKPPLFKEGSFHIGFHILRYFTTDEIDLTSIFETDSYTKNVIDYSLSWNIFMVLKMITGLNFPKESVLTINFAKQLESMGFWPFSIFILQFIKNEHLRTSLVRKMILSHIQFLDSNLSIFKNIEISNELIDECRAFNLRDSGEETACVQYLISAGKYEKAFEISIKNHIPDLFLSNSFDKLIEHLSIFEQSFFSKHHNFQCNGKVYIDYISTFSHIRKGGSQPNEICDKYLNILKKILIMDVSNRLQQLARRSIAIECMKYIGKFDIKRLNLSDLISRLVLEPENFSIFIQNNLNNIV